MPMTLKIVGSVGSNKQTAITCRRFHILYFSVVFVMSPTSEFLSLQSHREWVTDFFRRLCEHQAFQKCGWLWVCLSNISNTLFNIIFQKERECQRCGDPPSRAINRWRLCQNIVHPIIFIYLSDQSWFSNNSSIVLTLFHLLAQN